MKSMIFFVKSEKCTFSVHEVEFLGMIVSREGIVDLPKGRRTIKGRWVFAFKSGGCKKTRFIANRFTQIFRIDYEETFSPVARFKTFRLLLSLAVLHDWEIQALDVKTAYIPFWQAG